MSAYSDDARPVPAFFANFEWLKEKINATVRRLSEAVEGGKCSCSAEMLLKPIKQSVKRLVPRPGE